MLWRKESDDKNAMYVDIFRMGYERMRIEEQYVLAKMSKLRWNVDSSHYKNNNTANQLRQKGNERFKKNRFSNAMEWYNKSLCFATMGSESMGLAYANRSACFLEMKMFERCLVDIELAEQNKYPRKLINKLRSRKLECLELMESEEDRGATGSPKLDFQPNEKFPCMASAVDFQINAEFGRHIVATEDIEIGKTLLVEQWYFGVTQYDHYQMCNICLKKNLNFVPCPKCTNAQFCANCKDNDLHKTECEMTYGCPANFKPMDVVRSISLAKNAFTNADELISFVECMLNSDVMEVPSNLDDQRSKYRAFFKLCPDWRRYEFYLQQTYLFHQLLLEQDDMKAFFHTEAHSRFLAHLIQHHISMILRGSFNKRTAPMGGENISDTYVNIVAKHLTHSCTPNVVHYFEDGFIKCIAIRPIKKSEQLFISYIACDFYKSEDQRLVILRSRFVDCTCKRCQLQELKSNLQMKFDSDFKKINKMFVVEDLIMERYDCKQINSMIEKCFSLLNKFGQMEWSSEIDRIMVVLSFLLNGF